LFLADTACIQLDNRETQMDHELLFLVKRCKKLVSLDLTAMVDLEIVKRVCKLRDEDNTGKLKIKVRTRKNESADDDSRGHIVHFTLEPLVLMSL
jgi:hypothetical protein